MSILSRKIGIDLGTSTVLIYVKGEGSVVNEPSLAAVNRDRTRILAVGNQAFAMVGRAPESIQVVRPMRDGAIADFVVTEGMLQHLIGKVQGRQRLFKPEIMICVPSGVTSVERRAVTEAAISAGAILSQACPETSRSHPTISSRRSRNRCGSSSGLCATCSKRRRPSWRRTSSIAA